MMQLRRRALARTMAVVGVAMLVVGCAGSSGAGGMSPSATVTTAIQGWEYYFRIDWTVQPRPNGNEIEGYLYNQYGETAMNMRILAQGLDEKGNLIGQKLEWVPGTVPALQRTFFKVASLPPAPQYRVSVWAFDWTQGVGNDRR